MINGKLISSAQVCWKLIWGDKVVANKIYFLDGDRNNLVFSNLTNSRKELETAKREKK
jgi:hypothetical protein